MPGGGFLVALAAGLAVSGSIILLLFPPLGIAWALIGGALAGMVVRQARQVVTVTIAAVALPVVDAVLRDLPDRRLGLAGGGDLRGDVPARWS